MWNRFLCTLSHSETLLSFRELGFMVSGENNKERVFHKERKPTICPGARSIVDRMDEIKRRGRPESARLNTGRSVTRRNSANGALPIPKQRSAKTKATEAKDPDASKSVTVWSHEHALRHQPKPASSNYVSNLEQQKGATLMKRDG
jgi:hypothetical protein